MTTLHDGLAELAEDAPSGWPVPDLWDRGRRVRRVRTTGTAIIVAASVLALVGILGVTWQRSEPSPTPAPANSVPALPNRVWMPSPWLPGTEAEGELGQLAAVQHAPRGHWTSGTTDEVVGISATTGEYRFLDLPDQAPGEVALAPDGRHLAYWFTGDTTGSPNTETGPVVGVAVYDTTTGETHRLSIPSEHGLSVGSDLIWADPGRLLFSYGKYAGGDGDSGIDQHSSVGGTGLLVWEPGSGAEPGSIPGVEGTVLSSTGHGQLLVSGNYRYIWVDLDEPSRAVRFRAVNPIGLRVVAVDDLGTRLAGPLGNRSPAAISVVRFADGSRSAPRKVTASGETFDVLAWLDPRHVAAVRRTGTGFGPSALFRVDVRTGEPSEILRYPNGTYGSGTELATDLLGAPTATREAPPDPPDPRVVLGLSAGTVLVGLGVLVLWRRRRVRV